MRAIVLALAGRTRKVALLCAGAGMLAACGRGASDRRLMLGVILGHPDVFPAVTEVPGTAVRGMSVEVTVVTYGGGCVERGPTEIEFVGGSAIITPLDYHLVAELGVVNVNCADIGKEFLHRAELVFNTAGEKEIIFRGLDQVTRDTTYISHTLTVM